MEITQTNSSIDKISQEELQHLITVSTGFIDAYIIGCFSQEAMILPQNIVLSAMDVKSGVTQIEWHDLQLPVYSVASPDKASAVALVIEGEELDQRFALLCDEMPQTIRIRISEIVDEDRPAANAAVFQYVKMDGKSYQIPNLRQIYDSLQ